MAVCVSLLVSVVPGMNKKMRCLTPFSCSCHTCTISTPHIITPPLSFFRLPISVSVCIPLLTSPLSTLCNLHNCISLAVPEQIHKDIDLCFTPISLATEIIQPTSPTLSRQAITKKGEPGTRSLKRTWHVCCLITHLYCP
jgi:hypothetical protein